MKQRERKATLNGQSEIPPGKTDILALGLLLLGPKVTMRSAIALLIVCLASLSCTLGVAPRSVLTPAAPVTAVTVVAVTPAPTVGATPTAGASLEPPTPSPTPPPLAGLTPTPPGGGSGLMA